MKNKNTPEYIRTSLAAAISLGFEPGRFKEPVCLTGLNLLLTYEEGCRGKCAYCGISASGHQSSAIASRDLISKEAGSKKNTFIRVKWPVYRLEDVLESIKLRQANFKRVCISMITHRNAVKDTAHITDKIRSASRLPISILITPTLIKSPEVLMQFKNCGAEMIGVAVDAATRDIFEKYRGRGVKGPHNWDKYWQVLKWSVEIFGRYMAGIHLIAGLGETEKQAVETISRAHAIGAKTHLFSFCPEPRSVLEDIKPPLLISYRKIQIARYLINEKNFGLSGIKFNSEGEIIHFDYDISRLVDEGYAFMTSGCPCNDNAEIAACNRPFANERPSENFRNYPYIPEEEDKKIIEKQISALTK